MIKHSKRLDTILMLIILIFLFSGCEFIKHDDVDNSIAIKEADKVLVLNQNFVMNNIVNGVTVYYESSNEKIIEIDGRYGLASGYGDALIYAYSRTNDELIKTYLVSVISSNPTSIIVDGKKMMTKGDTQNLELSISPISDINNVKYESNDETIATVDETGTVKAISSGLVTIKVSSIYNNNISDEINIIVKDKYEEDGGIINQYTSSNSIIDISSTSKALLGIIDMTKQSVIVVRGYISNSITGASVLSSNASGVIYKRTCILSNGEEVEEQDALNFTMYKYYVITCKNIIDKMNKVTIYNGKEEVEANVIASDTKVDISVITFVDTKYFQTAKFGDSNKCITGEFIIAVGNTYNNDGIITSSLGVISYNYRYVADDTDQDSVNDWDALYLQHDAPVSEGNSGGPLVNLKGEIVGINSLKISEDKIDNMAFAIPSNTVLDLVTSLEKGIVPTRPLLGINIISVKVIRNNDILHTEYNLPTSITYGMYVVAVDDGGIGSVAGLKAGDILLEFNNIKIFYTYELRAAINECIIGSNEEIVLKVYRNGEIITLKAVF